MSSHVLTINEVAELLRVSRYTVYRLASRGELPGRKIGRVWRFPKGAIEKHLSGHGADCTSSERAKSWSTGLLTEGQLCGERP